jgi:hypothetical protein
MAASYSKFGEFTFYFQDEEGGEVVATESVIVECPAPGSIQEDRIAAKLATEVAVMFERWRRRDCGDDSEFFIKAGQPAASYTSPGFEQEFADGRIGNLCAWRVNPGDKTQRRV